jgi:GT2 family glycosyltransferase
MGLENKINPHVAIIVLNWNEWRYTIECINSILKNEYVNYHLVICDNHSTNDSVKKIKHHLKVNKKKFDEFYFTGEEYKSINNKDNSITIINSYLNLGYAGGNNIGINYVLGKGKYSYIWILNNDTYIARNSLVYLLKKMASNNKIGICGSTIIEKNTRKEKVYGGYIYNKWIGISHKIKLDPSIKEFDAEKFVENSISYVSGASMFISAALFKSIGLLNENYFLYYEELDLVYRSRNKFKLGYASRSKVFHYGGASIGSHKSVDFEKKYRSEYFLIKSRLKFTINYYPYMLPTNVVGIFITIFVRAFRFEWLKAYILLKVLFEIFVGKEEMKLIK